eukprot:TRINITY_DN9831_c0_g1_i3.p1 TRINITY_DN9831_c0_g1~~TRINITY_DN9831_c0_g1_i3.p1  ORF type:complete len:629 (-),score=126.06 TRINITY_DN9831_c0_g1_i3:28-1914(-)
MATLFISEASIVEPSDAVPSLGPGNLFSRDSQALVYNYKANAVQRMLDFDYVVKRRPSVAGLIKPGGSGFHKVFFGAKELLLPVYGTTAEAVEKQPQAQIFVNFASQRSAYVSTLGALEAPTIKTAVIIAEGVPEQEVRKLISLCKKTGKTIIGPATVGGIQAGAFKIGDTAGTLENIVACKLYRPGSVGFVSKSGGMSNEMYNQLSRVTDGIYEGIAIGGDTFPCSTFIDHVLRFQEIPSIKIIVLLGELGGDEEDEYAVAEAVRSGKITKPVCAWVTGTCAALFKTEIQFGHAGARGGGRASESAAAKNKALRDAGCHVPESFEQFPALVKSVYDKLPATTLADGVYPTEKEVSSRMFQLKTRKGSNFISTISDDRGDEPTYCRTPISALVEANASVGHVIGLLWLKKHLPAWATKFIELCIILTADHGPCVSGAHNTIVASRAGKDLVSCICSGLLTIGPRFGGAIDEAAKLWKFGVEKEIAPLELVEMKKREGVNISGIGHRVKNIYNPDKRVQILKEYAANHFPQHKYLDYALAVERITTQKGTNLILNVDGTIAALFLDCLTNCPNVSANEVTEVVEIGLLNGLFVLARTIGLVGHTLDQKRLKQGLYRHPWDDVLYLQEEI